MLKLKGLLVCLRLCHGCCSGILGIQAEVAQNKVKHLRLWIFECRDPSHEAFKLLWDRISVGLSTLVIGMISNNKSRASCGVTHHHFLSIGGILCFVHGLFSVAYYVPRLQLPTNTRK
ncbi:Detected protein of confused Function [Hibiscus syriacus]|uniref:Detected protein of confused Function n=1 Tax=Hibiscus syriacus TaxID=106335 RepID=A0A6A2YWV1_HIBSY|nr:Detected protein of confused Function [Hibiscus syriacus]